MFEICFLETMKTLTLFFLTPYELSEEYIYLISSLLNFAGGCYRDWETDRKSTRLNSSHSAKSRMPSSA